METISFNGKTYNTLEEMPAEQRSAYEQVMAFMKDENHNGIPDRFEGDAIQKMLGMVNTRIIVNGQEMQGIESLTPEARAKFDKAMLKLGQIGITAPGFVSATPTQVTPQMAPSEPAFIQSPSFLKSTPSAISDDNSSRTWVIIAALAVFLLCALALAAVFLYLYFNS